jgi:hypothetical protein
MKIAKGNYEFTDGVRPATQVTVIGDLSPVSATLVPVPGR